MQQADPTYRASVAEKITGVPAHSQRTWRKQGLLPSEKEEASWTEYAIADLITMVVMQDLSKRYGIGLKHAARIGQEVALVGLRRRRIAERPYGEHPYVLVTDLDGEYELCTGAGISWKLQREGTGPMGIVVDAIAVTFAIANALRSEGQELPPWLDGLQAEYREWSKREAKRRDALRKFETGLEL